MIAVDVSTVVIAADWSKVVIAAYRRTVVISADGSTVALVESMANQHGKVRRKKMMVVLCVAYHVSDLSVLMIQYQVSGKDMYS